MTDLTGTCLCGACGWTYAGQPTHATACNCTACRRFGALWIYGRVGRGVEVTGPVVDYARGPRNIAFLHCPTCGSILCWRGTAPAPDGEGVNIGVNLRMAEPAAVAALPVRSFDGHGDGAEITTPGRTVADVWV